MRLESDSAPGVRWPVTAAVILLWASGGGTSGSQENAPVSPPAPAPGDAALVPASNGLSPALGSGAGAGSPAPQPPAPPYAIRALALPEAAQGQAAGLDFAPDGRWVLLARSGAVFTREGQDDWRLWSSHGLEGASGLFAGYFPLSLYVVHPGGISRIFDTDEDQQADFVKAVVPTWRFGTLGELFRGGLAVLPGGDLLTPLRVPSGPWLGAIARLPEEGVPALWAGGFQRIAAPSPGPQDTWAVAGWRASGPPDEDASGGQGALHFVAREPGESPDAGASGPDEEEPEAKAPSPPSDQANEDDATGEAPENRGEAVPGGKAGASPAATAGGSPRGAGAGDEGTETSGDANADEASPGETRLGPAAILLPASLLSSPPVSPAFPPDDATAQFGPFSGQGFVAGDASKRLLRLMPDAVDGAWQGGATDFASIESPAPGIAFLRFSPDGKELLVGQGGQLVSIQPGSGALHAARRIRLASDGFEVHFTRPVDRKAATDPARWRVHSWPTEGEESEAEDFLASRGSVKVVVDSDGFAATLLAGDLAAGRVFRFDLSRIPDEEGNAISHGPVFYTLNRLRPVPEPASATVDAPPDSPATPAEAASSPPGERREGVRPAPEGASPEP